MLDLQQGFRIDGRLVPWGTSLAEANRLLRGELRNEVSNAAFRCREVCGFAVVSGELAAPALDRPVLSISVELAPSRWRRRPPEYWVAPLAAQLGPPASTDHQEIPPYADAAGAVRFCAEWQGTGFSVGLSIYGALRAVDGGRSAGMLWLTWDEVLAAKPFLPAWVAHCDRLAAIAGGISSIQRFAVDQPIRARHDDIDGEAATPVAGQRRAARLSLYEPQILATPDVVASTLDAQGFAIWTSAAAGIWGVSSVWDTVTFLLGSPVDVDWTELLPAKGGGASDPRIGGWSVRAGSKSPGIAAAAEALKAFAGVTLKYTESYDC